MPDLNYATAAASAARKRKMAEMLQQQMFKPNEVGLIPGSKMSWASALAPLLQGYASNKLDKEADEQESAAATRQQEGIAKLLQEIPKGTEEVPAQPIEQEAVGGPPPAAQEAAAAAPPPLAAAFGAGGMPNIGPRDNELTGSAPPATAEMAKLLGGPAPAPDLAGLAPPPEGGPSVPPLLPSLPTKMDMSIPGAEPKKFTDRIPGKEVSPEEWMQYGGKFLPLGPEAAKFGNTFQEKAMSQLMEPGTKRYIVAGNGDILDTKTNQYLSGGPMTKAKQAEVAGARDERMQLERDKLEAKINNDTATADERRRWHDMAEGLKRLGGKGDGGEKGTWSYAGTDKDGNPQMVNNKTNVVVPMGAGTPGAGGAPVPGGAPGKGTASATVVSPTNPVIRSTDEKEVGKAMALQNKATQAEKLADALDADAANGKTSAFSTGNNVKAWINDKTNGFAYKPSERLSPDQIAMRANAGRDFSIEMHDLFGAAFTDREGHTASYYNIKPGMSNKDVANMLRAQARFRREGMEAFPEKFRTAAAARAGGAPVPPGAPVAPAPATGGPTDAQKKAAAKYGVTL